MKISKNIEIIDLGLKIGRKLIVADLHIGFEEAFNKQGILVPRLQLKDTYEKLEKMIAAAKPDTIIVNGDLKHEFGTISTQEWREALKIIDLMIKSSKKVVLVKGNHDTILGPIAKKRELEIVDKYEIENHDKGKILIIHGDKKIEIPKKTKTIIIGHEHPAVSIREGVRQETYKCFLKGTYKGKELIVMPSFCTVTEGTDILRQDILSPYLHQELDDFEVFVISDKTYSFGKLKNIRRHS